MVELISEAKEEGRIRNLADPELIFTECLLFDVGFALYYCTEKNMEVDDERFRSSVRTLLNTEQAREYLALHEEQNHAADRNSERSASALLSKDRP